MALFLAWLLQGPRGSRLHPLDHLLPLGKGLLAAAWSCLKPAPPSPGILQFLSSACACNSAADQRFSKKLYRAMLCFSFLPSPPPLPCLFPPSQTSQSHRSCYLTVQYRTQPLLSFITLIKPLHLWFRLLVLLCSVMPLQIRRGETAC